MTQSNHHEPPSETSSATYRYRFEDVEYDEGTRILSVGGVEVAIEPRPRGVLLELLRRAGELVSKDALNQLVWDGRSTVDNVLANAVLKLRRALGQRGAQRIVTVARAGYRFDGSIERTVVNWSPQGTLRLATGEGIALRPGFVLDTRLGTRHANEVWLARDSKLHVCRVFKFAADEDRLRDIKREYTIYRVLRNGLGERDDFARVLSANFVEEPYFLECEFGGQDLVAWCDGTSRLAEMDIADRIALFLQIARAVAAAHSVGVLHKDLKPYNVLIAADGETLSIKLTDFGSSRLVDRARLEELRVTALGLTMTRGFDPLTGTPLYLAPELLAGHAPSTQSDVYALGLILYQMLAGDFRRPMTTGWQRDVQDELLRDDLTKATEGDPRNRLVTVDELIVRLSTLRQRHENAARRASEERVAADAVARLSKWRARRPWVVAAYVSLSVALVVSLFSYSQTRTALVTAQRETDRAQAINDFLNKDVLSAINVTQSAGAKPVSAYDVYERASRRASERFAGKPRLEAEVRYQLGQLYMKTSNTGAADRELLRAVALLQPIALEDDPLLLAIKFTQVKTFARSYGGGYESEARALLEKTERDAGPALLRIPSPLALVAAQARFEQALWAKNHQEAMPTGLRMIELADLFGDLETRFEARSMVAEYYERANERAKATALLEELTKAPFEAAGIGEVIRAKARIALAEHYVAGGRDAEAETIFIDVRNRLIDRVGPNEVQAGLASNDLAEIYEARGDYVAKATALDSALKTFAASLGEDHQYTNVTNSNLAITEATLGRSVEALRRFDSVRPWFKSHHALGRLPELEIGRAEALSDLHRYSEALQGLATIGCPIEKPDPSEIIFNASCAAEQGRALIGMGRVEEGLASLRPAFAELKRLPRDPMQRRMDEKRFGPLVDTPLTSPKRVRTANRLASHQSVEVVFRSAQSHPADGRPPFGPARVASLVDRL